MMMVLKSMFFRSFDLTIVNKKQPNKIITSKQEITHNRIQIERNKQLTSEKNGVKNILRVLASAEINVVQLYLG